MRKLLAVLAVAALGLGLFVNRGPAAPAIGDRPVKFEYAELVYSDRFVAPAPQPGAFPGPGVRQVTVVWSTSQDEVEAKSWDDLADKLKAPAPKKPGSETVQRLRVFDRLGAEGWEVSEHVQKGINGPVTWAFKRRVP